MVLRSIRECAVETRRGVEIASAEIDCVRAGRRTEEPRVWSRSRRNGENAISSAYIFSRRFFFRKNETHASVFPCRFNDPDWLGLVRRVFELIAEPKSLENFEIKF